MMSSKLFIHIKQFILFLPVCLFFIFFVQINKTHSQSLPNDEEAPFIKIGFLTSADTAQNRLAKQSVDALHLAIDRVNSTGGIRGQMVKALVRSVDGNWGTGTTKTVNLIYEHDVRAIMGFLDGQSAHLVEQVSVKAGVPFISTYSPDPTLSRINVPWFFSIMPRADQQIEALINEIYGSQQLKNIFVVSSDEYDYRYLTNSLLRQVQKGTYPDPWIITYRPGKANFKQIVSETAKSETEAIVFFGRTEKWRILVSQLNAGNIELPLFTPIMELDPEGISRSAVPVFTIQPEHWDIGAGKEFQEAFNKRYGYQPGIGASYVYDGAAALLDAIKSNGIRRSEIQAGLKAVDLDGINGHISFDSTGVIQGDLKVTQVQ